MNKAKLKTYAPQARKDFIAAVTARAHLLGISETNGQLDIAPAEKTGDIVLIAGQAWPAKVNLQRERLIQRMQKDGVAHTLDAIAYTWFNRFAALRCMEIHDYLGHGHRVLSSREGGLPEILAHATELVGTLPGLHAQQIADMKLAGNQDGELYRLLLVAQCNALSAAMPFLFERIDDETELLLPDNLLRTDSVITQLVGAIPEEDWADIEIIGWLYQFYISEKKDQVIGKVVKSEDIPAATQLFTPNWIVQYLVQNSIGRLWLMANPASSIKSQWPYYIEPAEQTPEVQAQLDALIQTRMDEDGGSLNPESITCLDPACGSGHILVEAYEVLKGIYLERGYRLRDIPRLILEKNLYGLDIDDRAAQLAGFALLMKARADDRRLLDNPPRLNVLALQDSKKVASDQWSVISDDTSLATSHSSLIAVFEHAKTFGSLIQIPKVLEDGLPGLEEGIAKAIETGDVFARAAAQDLAPLVQQARILGMKFDAVVANPPYMGGKWMNPLVKKLAKDHFPNTKSDLFACFIERGYAFAKGVGYNSMVTMESWMFLSSYEAFRDQALQKHTLISLAHFPYNGKRPTAMGINFGVAVMNTQNVPIPGYRGHYCCSRYYELNDDGIPFEFPTSNERLKIIASDEFKKIPGSPVAYWVSSRVRKVFQDSVPLGETAEPRQGMATTDNKTFLRLWHEVAFDKFARGCSSLEEARESGCRWFPYNKGGYFRKWYGNNEYVVDYEADGLRLKTLVKEKYREKSYAQGFTDEKWEKLIEVWVLKNQQFYFKPSITWSFISSAFFGVRRSDHGFIFDVGGSSAFPADEKRNLFVGFLCSSMAFYFMKALNPTLNFQVENVAALPIIENAIREIQFQVNEIVEEAVRKSRFDWDASETSWDFKKSPLLIEQIKSSSIFSSWDKWSEFSASSIARMKYIEEENNRLFIEAYGLEDELSSDVSEDQITLTRADREKDSQRLISYAIGCMMGRYSLDEPGLIYAHAGNVGFDATRYKTFPADADGIIPITDELWFEDDAANRVREFLIAVWGNETLDKNLAWLAESLGAKGNETPTETLRRYLASSFFKDHLQTYKKRPIYWLFSSGKQGAFQALVYLHRYHEGTLARMRAEYVVPLTGKMQSRIEMLEKDKDAAPSTAARNKLAKQIEALKRKHVELLAYDEKLRHYADRRISLDLDDGVKVNYGKFGDLLAEVKAVTGGAGDD